MSLHVLLVLLTLVAPALAQTVVIMRRLHTTTTTSTSTSSTTTTTTSTSTSTSTAGATTTTATTTTTTTSTTPPAAWLFIPDDLSTIAAINFGSTANRMYCHDFIPRSTVSAATKMAWSIGGVAASTACSVTLYNADGTTIIRTSGAKDCSTQDTIISATGLSAFTVTRGTTYRECWCNNGTSGQYRSALSGWTSFTGLEFDLHNSANATRQGIAANACTAGAAPSTTGTVTGGAFGSDGFPPLLQISE